MGRRSRKDEDETESLEIIDAWTRWREAIPTSEREKVAEIVSKADLTSKVGINALAQSILVETFRGTLSPTVLTAAKPWIEVIIYNIDSMNQVAGLGRSATAFDTVTMLADLHAKVRPLQPTYVVAALPERHDVIENDREGVIDKVKAAP